MQVNKGEGRVWGEGAPGGVLALTRYTCMCLPFRVVFHRFGILIGWFLSQMKAPNFTKKRCILENFGKKAPNFSQIGCFSIKIGILMGGFLSQK